MKGRTPKDPALRQRTNKSVTRATFIDEPPTIRVPALPKHMTWHTMTKKWWKEVWTSPMASEFLKVDSNSLLMLAVLINKFWEEPSKNLASEIRLQQQAFGLTPLDRRRLEWQVIQAEDAKDKHHSRRSQQAITVTGDGDPRDILNQ
jgi:hypothetical protein